MRRHLIRNGGLFGSVGGWVGGALVASGIPTNQPWTTVIGLALGTFAIWLGAWTDVEQTKDLERAMCRHH